MTDVQTQKTFDPIRYKETTLQQWESAAQPWHRWGSLLAKVLASAGFRDVTSVVVDAPVRVDSAATCLRFE